MGLDRRAVDVPGDESSHPDRKERLRAFQGRAVLGADELDRLGVAERPGVAGGAL